jgi:hypothetical protein
MAFDPLTRIRLQRVWSKLECRGLRERVDSDSVRLHIDHSSSEPRPVLHPALFPMRTEFPGGVIRRTDLNAQLRKLIS